MNDVMKIFRMSMGKPERMFRTWNMNMVLQRTMFLLLCVPGLLPFSSTSVSASGEVFHAKVSDRTPQELARRDFMSVCPPFFLKDQDGNIIDPVHGINSKVPYSPKKTCGQCHDYERITSGYHFQEGADEKLSPRLAAVYPWMRTPGQYGGRY